MESKPTTTPPVTPVTGPVAPVKAATPVLPTRHAFELPSAIYSPALLESVMYDIQFYLDWTRQNQIREKVGAKAKDEPTHSAETVLVIEAWLGGKPATMASIEDLLSHLRT